MHKKHEESNNSAFTNRIDELTGELISEWQIRDECEAKEANCNESKSEDLGVESEISENNDDEGRKGED